MKIGERISSAKRKFDPAGIRRALSLLVLVVSGVVFSPAEAGVESTELRSNAASKLLFWSSYDFSVDAAALLFGPLDVAVRGGADAADASATIARETELVDPNRTLLENETDLVEDEEQFVFSLYQKGDGSESDPDGIPTRYLRMQENDRELAAKALESTLRWREEHDIDHILSKPHTKFDICKEVFPHFFIGRGPSGHVVFVQRPALLDLERARANNLTEQELLMHYVYVNEYLWQVLEESSPLGTMISVLDLSGLDFSILKKTEMIGFVKEFVSTMDAHFPQRAHKTLILNAPKWFNVFYKMLSPLLRQSTKAKIEIHSRGKKQDEALTQWLGQEAADLMPSAFWSRKHNKQKHGEAKIGSDDDEDEDANEVSAGDRKIPQTEFEKGLRSFVSQTFVGTRLLGKRSKPLTLYFVFNRHWQE